MAYDPKTAGFNPEQQYFDPWAFDFSLPEEPAPLPAVPAPTDANARRLLVPDGGDPGMPDDGTPTDRGTPGLDPSLGGPKGQWQGPGTGLGGQVPEDWWSDQFSNSWGQTAFEKAGMIAGPIGSVITGGINAKINIDKYNEVAEKMGLEKMGVGTGIAQTLAPFDVVGRMAQSRFTDAVQSKTPMSVEKPGIPGAGQGTTPPTWSAFDAQQTARAASDPNLDRGSLAPGSQMNYGMAGQAPQAPQAPDPAGFSLNTGVSSPPQDAATQAFNSMMSTIDQMQSQSMQTAGNPVAPGAGVLSGMPSFAGVPAAPGGWQDNPYDSDLPPGGPGGNIQPGAGDGSWYGGGDQEGGGGGMTQSGKNDPQGQGQSYADAPESYDW